MSKILNRDEFGIEIDKYKNGQSINEGLLQYFKSLFKQDWKNIKSSSTALKIELEKIDKSLDGFTVLKRSNYDACAKFRQALCDFANNLLDYKLDELEKGTNLKKVVMDVATEEEKIKHELNNSSELNIVNNHSVRNKAMREKLLDSEKSVDEIIKKYPVISQWANTMKKSVKNLINDIIVSKSDDDDAEIIKKKIEQNKKDTNKEIEKDNNKALKNQEDKIKEISNNRNNTLNNIGVKSLSGMKVQQTIKQLSKGFDNIVNKLRKNSIISDNKKYDFNSVINEATEKENFVIKIKNLIGDDKLFSLDKIIENIGNDYTNASTRKSIILKYLKMLRYFYKKIDDLDDKSITELNDVPSESIHAMYVALAYVIAYGMMNTDKLISDDILDLITRCCIASDATIGYSFPLVDKDDEKKGTIFVSYMGELAPENYTSYDKDIKTYLTKKTKTDSDGLLIKFNKRMKDMVERIKKEADKIKEDAEKEREKENNK